MNCNKVNEKLLFFLDNELSKNERQQIELHLAACPACREKLQDLENTQGLLRQSFDSVNEKSVPFWIWMELEQRLAISSGGSKLFSRMRTRLQAFIGCWPSWRLVLAGVLAIALVASSVTVIPRLLSPPPEVMASDIAIDSPEVRALAGGTPSIEASEVSATTGYVLSQGAAGESNLACVDLQQNTVVRVFRIPISPLTDEDKTQSLTIARDDPNVQQILDSGGTINESDIFPLSPRLRLEIIDGQPVVWNKGALVGVVIKMKSLIWVARIDLSEGKVVNVSRMIPPSPTPAVEQSDVSNAKKEVTEIAESDIRVKALLDQGAEVDHVAIGRDGMVNSGAMILKLGEEVWSAKVDLNSRTVTRVETIPKARPGTANLFIPE